MTGVQTCALPIYGKETTDSNIVYVGSNRDKGSSTTNINYWITSSDGSIRVNRLTREVEIIKGGTDQKPVVCNKDTINQLVSNSADRINKLTIKSTVADGTVEIDGLTVNGNTIVEGGGSSSVKFTNCNLKSTLKAKKAKGTNPLHLLFGTGTSLDRVEIEGENVIITTNINIGTIYTKSSVLLKGNGKEIGRASCRERV